MPAGVFGGGRAREAGPILPGAGRRGMRDRRAYARRPGPVCHNKAMAQVLRLRGGDPSVPIERCREVLARGGLVVVPTDTVYGLAARADMSAAVARIFAVKGRGADRALVVMVPSREAAAALVAPEGRGTLARLASFWPGPLTVVARTVDVPWRRWLAPHSEKLGIRVPDSPFLLRLLALTGPLAVTSANFSGNAAPATFRDVDPGLLLRVELAVDGGRCGSGKPSTVAEIGTGGVRLLRHGEIGEEELMRALAAGRGLRGTRRERYTGGR